MSQTMNTRLQLAVQAAMQRRGTQVTLRPISKTGTPARPNPPTLVSPVMANQGNIGDIALNISAASAYGQINAGDILTIAGQALTVAANVTSQPNIATQAGFSGVTFTPALTAAIAAGTAIVPTWQADLKVWAAVNSFPQNLVDNELILASDLSIRFPAIAGFDPAVTWQVIVSDPNLIKTIIGLTPIYAWGTVQEWVAQAR